MGRKCSHQFIRLSDDQKTDGEYPSRPIYGAMAGCVLCGEVRSVYEDGEIRLIEARGEFYDPDKKLEQEYWDERRKDLPTDKLDEPLQSPVTI